MSTINGYLENGVLKELHCFFDSGEETVRSLYLLSRANTHFELKILPTCCEYTNDIPLEDVELELSDSEIDHAFDLYNGVTRQTLYEEMEALWRLFCLGDIIAYDRKDAESRVSFKNLIPHNQHVWELKTERIRFVGWFYKKDEFIVSSIHLKETLGSGGVAVSGLVNECIFSRNEHQLFKSNFVKGDYEDCVSNCYDNSED